jgi:hypothetical protein
LSDDVRIVLAGRTRPGWRLADLERVRRELDIYIGPDRRAAIAACDRLIARHRRLDDLVDSDGDRAVDQLP